MTVPFLAWLSSWVAGLARRLVNARIGSSRVQLTLVNVWQNTTLGDCDMSEKLVQFLVVSNGELQMSWDDTGLLVVSCCVTGQLENFGSEVLKHGSEVHRGTSTDSLSVVALSEKSVNSTDWKGETSLG